MKKILPVFFIVLMTVLGMIMPGHTFGEEKTSVAGLSTNDRHQSHWSYQGFRGPRLWGFLEDAYRECRIGHQQSPIDIVMPHHADHQEDLIFQYSDNAFQVVMTEHGLRIENLGINRLVFNQRTYRLRQFHFHDPSEHHIHGKEYPMEIHLVHEDATGHLLVVAVLVNLGKENSTLARIQNWVQQDEKPRAINNVEKSHDSIELNVQDFIPHTTHHFSYHGSLTTPPCTQGVQWILLRTPIDLSQNQLDWFASLTGVNARPIQPLYKRQVEEY